MTMAAYFTIGLVVWAIEFVNQCIREGWESMKEARYSGWVWFTDIIIGALIWPMFIFCWGLCAVSDLLELFETKG